MLSDSGLKEGDSSLRFGTCRMLSDSELKEGDSSLRFGTFGMLSDSELKEGDSSLRFATFGMTLLFIKVGRIRSDLPGKSLLILPSDLSIALSFRAIAEESLAHLYYAYPVIPSVRNLPLF